jgi:hypothetical protein
MPNTNRTDRLTNAATACRTYAELTARCATGYAPTLRAGDRDQGALGRLLERDGHRVFWA